MRKTKEERVRSGRAVSLPKDAPMALRKAAGLAMRAGEARAMSRLLNS